jgi:site-specific recombinase XerD
LAKEWDVEAVLPTPKRPQTLPVVLSPEEVLQFLRCVLNQEHHAILTTCYAAGVRVSEAIRLNVSDIDSGRVVVRVAYGKGSHHRYVMLSQRLLETLRAWWRVKRTRTRDTLIR